MRKTWDNQWYSCNIVAGQWDRIKGGFWPSKKSYCNRLGGGYMTFTLYDYLIIYQYKIIEAIKTGFPRQSDYNQWIFNSVLKPLLDGYKGEYSIFEPGVYQLGDYYIGKTSKPIILRIINHLFDTIPTVKTDITMQNMDKILCTKIDLLLNKSLEFQVLSDNPEDEESYIKEYSQDNDDYSCIFLTNKIHNRNKKTFLDYFKGRLLLDGYDQNHGTVKEFSQFIYDRGLEEYGSELVSFYKEGVEAPTNKAKGIFDEYFEKNKKVLDSL